LFALKISIIVSNLLLEILILCISFKAKAANDFHKKISIILRGGLVAKKDEVLPHSLNLSRAYGRTNSNLEKPDLGFI